MISARFNNIPLLSASFNIGKGIMPGQGTITYLASYGKPDSIGSLYLDDNNTAVIINEIICSGYRISKTSESGSIVSASIYDRRFFWKWGATTYIANQIDIRGHRRQEVLLADVLKALFNLKGEDVILIDIPVVYPKIALDVENIAASIEQLCHKYALEIGYSFSKNNKYVVCPYDYKNYWSTRYNYTSEEFAHTNYLKPSNLVFVTDRKVLQRTFVDLIPVGLEPDGTVKPIDDLSYKPSGFDAYTDNIWGRYLMSMFNGLSEANQVLANQCIFKWYMIDWSVYDIDIVLPLLNNLAEYITVEGITKLDSPYVKMKQTLWDGVKLSNSTDKVAIREKYAIDRKTGIIKFNEPQVLPCNSSGSAVTSYDVYGFIRKEIDLVAAYEAKEGKLDDTYNYYEKLPGGIGPNKIIREKAIKPLVLVTKEGNNLVEEITNKDIIDTYAKEAINRYKSKYNDLRPEVVTEVGLINVDVYGDIKRVSWSVDANKAITTIEMGIDLPKIDLPDIEERTNRKYFKLQMDNLL